MSDLCEEAEENEEARTDSRRFIRKEVFEVKWFTPSLASLRVGSADDVRLPMPT